MRTVDTRNARAVPSGAVVPTARGWSALGLAAGLTIAGWVAASPPALALGMALVVALGVAWLSAVSARRRSARDPTLHAALTGPEFVPRGDAATIDVTVTGARPPYGCWIGLDRRSVRWSRTWSTGSTGSTGSTRSDDRPSASTRRWRALAAPAGRRTDVNPPGVPRSAQPVLAVPSLRRGIYSCQGAALWLHDPLGIVGGRLVAFPDLSLVVHPVASKRWADATRRRNAGAREGDGVSGRPTSGHGFELVGVRPYVAGDRLSLVHWRSSVGPHPLLVREMGSESARPVRLVVDDRAGVHRRAAFEHAVDLVTAVVVDRPDTAPPLELCSLASGHSLLPAPGVPSAELLRWLAALEPRRTRHGRSAKVHVGMTVDPGDIVITTSTGSTSLAPLAKSGAMVVLAA